MDKFISAAEHLHLTFHREPWFVSAGVGKDGDGKPIVVLYTNREIGKLDTSVPQLKDVPIHVKVTPFTPIVRSPIRIQLPPTFQLTLERLAWLAKLPLFEYPFKQAILSPKHVEDIGGPKEGGVVEVEPGLKVSVAVLSQPGVSLIEYT